jgi:hypothetical protein
MKSLLDIAAPPATEKVRGVDIAVPGISAAGVAVLVGRYDGIRRLVLAGEFNLDAQKILDTGPAGVADFIACGTGHPGEEDHEQVAATLPIGDQVALITKIMQVTFPDGAKNFQARCLELLAAAGISLGSSPEESPTSSSAVTQIQPRIHRAS